MRQAAGAGGIMPVRPHLTRCVKPSAAARVAGLPLRAPAAVGSA